MNRNNKATAVFLPPTRRPARDSPNKNDAERKAPFFCVGGSFFVFFLFPQNKLSPGDAGIKNGGATASLSLCGLMSALTFDFWLLKAPSALMDDITAADWKCTHIRERQLFLCFFFFLSKL